MAGVEADSIQYVETHGTATQLGDPIEIAALSKAYCLNKREADKPLVLGAVKANIGHLDTAAGMAGMVKTVSALKHQTLPGNAYFEKANSAIDLQANRIVFNQQPSLWPGDRPRRAGVSSFGIGGTNAHLILQVDCNLMSMDIL